MEAQYIGCSEATREAIWLRRLYHEIMDGQSDTNKPSIQLLLSDSQGAIGLATTPRFNDQTKHIEVKYHFIRDAYTQDLINLTYLPSSDMTSVRYGASGAPKNAGPRLNSQPSPAEWPGAGRVF